MTDDRLERLRERMNALDKQEKSARKPGLPMRFQVARFLTTALFFAGLVVVLIEGVSLGRDYNGWRNAGSEASARAAYVTFIEVDIALIVLAIAALLGAAWWVRWWIERD